MGAKNCPETPRQKMIGMMYLVLTAMLALNVSADVLDAFTKVQQGLTSTIANFTKKNADLYNDIEMAYNLNQTKVAAVREKTNEIRKSTQELVDYIEQLKYKMVVLADGEEDADVMNIKAKDNLDIGGQVMVLQGKGKELREMITAYREQLSGLIADKDSVLKNSVLTHLATDDPKPVDGEFKSWEVSKFEGIPLVGVVTLLTMYQADILSTESDVVKYLFSSMDAESFKFNKLEALVIPESRYILKGETFKAKIMLAATDSTQKPVVIANGRNVAYQGDYAVYSEPATTAGFRKVKGVINYITPSGTSLPRDFELEYEVADPAVVISPTKMNVFYLGVDNPVALAAPGISPEAIEPQITNGTIHKQENGKYIVRPAVAGKPCSITVMADVQGQKRELQTQTFRVKEVPDPVAKVNGQKGGKIKKNVLMAAGQVDVEMENFDFDMKFTVENFSIYTVIDGFVQEVTKSDKGNFSDAQLKMIGKLKRNQTLTIENIVVKGPDGTTRKLQSIPFRIE
ncbi:gliding motility protein GldM [Odoribacter splanchnicus]|uniref:type IX secretion system motor protein PorM/GldM n=1 Tax=Odoribacter splanchnicus TaxID=28118 RepID=UPI00192438A4|nr:gliding motility protein GldM [Odoribacter splanchnicus]MDB9245269.1 gliding motility protein GldM [Odoribacter splanchnicus]